ncbi:ATP-binding cassette sub-family G member 1 [Halotydeus destructor]|nr:ATP-binding cassette sub-family G member 1 [Halotydeus destructor]
MWNTRQPVDLSWTNLSYTLSSNTKSSRSVILSCQSGRISGGCLTAVMGPSGAGKTTLVSCILGRVTDGLVDGDINLSTKADKVNVRFVPQFDSVWGQFTVFENLIFSSKMQNRTLSKVEHTKKVNRILKELDLKKAAHTKTNRLSGGQKKRLAMGVEIISDPDILILDEPTTGLDSATAAICISLLKKLAVKKKMAALAIIHQPSNEVFMTFDMLYLLTNKGEQLYFGPPKGVLGFLEEKGFECPKKSSIPEFAIKAADSGKEGICDHSNNNNEDSDSDSEVEGQNDGKQTRDCQALMNPVVKFSWYHVNLLFRRGFDAINIKSPFLFLSVTLNILSSIMVAFATEDPFGNEDGCQLAINDTIPFNDLKGIFNEKYEAIKGVKITMFGPAAYVVLVNTAISSVEFPYEYKVMRREYTNKWYNIVSYMIAKLLCGLVECLITGPLMVFIIYVCTEQSGINHWRGVAWGSIMTMTGIYYWLLGFIYGIIFKEDMPTAALVSVMTAIVLFLTRFWIKKSDMSKGLRPLLPLNLVEQAFSASVSVMYGFDRCPNISDDTVSLYEALSDSRSPFKIIGRAYNDINITRSDIRTWSPILNIPRYVLRDVKLALDDFTIDKSNKTVIEYTSYMLEVLGIEEDGRDVWKQILIMAAHIVFIIGVIYFRLRKAVPN